MNSSSTSEKTDARRLVEAAAWRTHLAENDLESTPAFEAWVGADTRNREAWDRAQRGWDLFGEHATSPELLDLRRRALGQARAMGRRRWATLNPSMTRLCRAAIAAGLVLFMLGGGIATYVMGPDVYQTGAGERRVVTLADGSQVQLDSLTELRVDYSKHARDLQLIKGQARFDVARDVERPFSVVAAGRKVVATGTAFNVDLLGKNLFVTLLEGKVAVLPQAAPTPHIPSTIAPTAKAAKDESALPKGPLSVPELRIEPIEPIELQAGQQLVVSEDGAATVTAASVQRATAWQVGQLVFENEPLSSVVARVNRYSTRQVNLMDEKTASLRISGVFLTGDVDRFVSTVTHYLPVKAQQGEDVIYLSAHSMEARASGQSR